MRKSTITVSNRAHRGYECLTRIHARVVECGGAAKDCGALRDSIVNVANAVAAIILVQVQSAKEFGSKIVMNEAAWKAMADQAAANDPAVVRSMAMDRPGLKAAVASRHVEAAASKLRADLEKQFAAKAQPLVQKAIDAFGALETSIKRAELRAGRPYSVRIGNNVAGQLQIQNLRVDIASMDIKALFDMYCSTLEVGDDDQAQLLEAAATPHLQKIVSEGMTAFVRGAQNKRPSAAGNEYALASQLLRAFDQKAEQRLPPEIARAKALPSALEECYRLTAGYDPGVGGNVSAVQFQKRYLSPGNQPPARFAVADGWVTRYLTGGEEPRLSPMNLQGQ